MPLPFLMPGLMAGGSLLSGLLGGRRSTQSRSSQTSPRFRGLESSLLNSLMGRLNQPSALPEGFEEQGISGINDTFSNIERTLGNSLVSRGLSGSPMAGASDRNLNFARGGEIARFRTNLPAMERQFRNQDIGLGTDLLRSQYPDQSSTSTVGGGGGQAFGDMSSMLAFLYGSGAFDNTKNPNRFMSEFGARRT